MTPQEHIERHKYLHRCLDELLADWISNTKLMPSTSTIMDLIQWSHQQTLQPDHKP